jgi:hypothetical protein
VLNETSDKVSGRRKFPFIRMIKTMAGIVGGVRGGGDRGGKLVVSRGVWWLEGV